MDYSDSIVPDSLAADSHSGALAGELGSDGDKKPEKPESDLTNEFFERAIKEFRESLTESERLDFQTFKTPEDLISHIKKQLSEQPLLPGPADKVCRSVKNFSDSLRPFFSVINTCIQANPDITALVWGALQFIFQVCRAYASSLRH